MCREFPRLRFGDDISAVCWWRNRVVGGIDENRRPTGQEEFALAGICTQRAGFPVNPWGSSVRQPVFPVDPGLHMNVNNWMDNGEIRRQPV